MIASFFRNLEERGVAYLLISGQATVLYGAATFSEDIDLWIEPATDNMERFRSALQEAGAQYYKLTPPLDGTYLQRGHGFHFVLAPQTPISIFLDIMGCPPRVRNFEAAAGDSRSFSTDWGTLPTVGIADLIELKKTQRLADYPIVSALTLRLLEEAKPSPEVLAWASLNLFTLESFLFFNENYPAWVATAPATIPLALRRVAGEAAGDIPASLALTATEWMNNAMSRHHLSDRAHWQPIIAELRELRSAGRLAPEGAPV